MSTWIEKSLFEFLDDNIEPAGGVWPLVRPQDGITPAIVYARVSGPRTYSMDGQVVAEGAFDIHCMAESYSGAKDLAESVRNHISAYSESETGVVVKVHYVDNEVDHYEDETRVFVCLLEVRILYHE